MMAAVAVLAVFPRFTFTLIAARWTRFASAPHLPKGTAQVLNLPFVNVLLHLGEFQCFQHLFHLIEHFLQRRDDPVHIVDRFGDGALRCGTELGPVQRFPLTLRFLNGGIGDFTANLLDG